MKTHPMHLIKTAWSAPLFSPAGLLVRATLIALAYAVCELSGLREYTTFLSGTQQGGWTTTVWLGLAHLVAYHAFVVLAPILVIASGLLAGIEHLTRR
ncbi:MAG: hypothetical protein ABII82_13085 [Verrucomicrobiota bacterium]